MRVEDGAPMMFMMGFWWLPAEVRKTEG